MKKLRGISASPGIAIGRIFLYLDDKLKVPQYDIHPDDLGNELLRFRAAVEKAADEIKMLKIEAAKREIDKESRFLDAHILMLSDPDFNSQIEQNLNTHLKNVEWILFLTVKKFITSLESAEDLYLRERTIDMYDVAKRVFNHLMFKERISLSDLNMRVVLVTHDLLPSDTIMMRKEKVKGIAMNAGVKLPTLQFLPELFRFLPYSDCQI